ncbi:MAG: hypothetical protein GC150_15390 [Rhizobiales bacterium]|nr:hypothetical protein [Hyphomicrobiales bacterium]
MKEILTKGMVALLEHFIKKRFATNSEIEALSNNVRALTDRVAVLSDLVQRQQGQLDVFRQVLPAMIDRGTANAVRDLTAQPQEPPPLLPPPGPAP